MHFPSSVKKVSEEDVLLIESYFNGLDESALKVHAQEYSNEFKTYLREQILYHNRIDLLIEDVLGYTLKEFHCKFLLAQEEAIPWGKFFVSLILGFRGSGKSTSTTVGRAIHEILRNPNIRILITSNTDLQARVFLREIKAHFENNQVLRDIFGDLVGNMWSRNEIVVKTRTANFRESTVTCLGVAGATASRHYDIIIADDLVDEENSRTASQRENLRVWFMKSLLPTLEPGGKLWMSGTYWNPLDLYHHLESSIPNLVPVKVQAIQPDGTSPWPEKFPVEHFEALKGTMTLPEFDSQYMMTTDSMLGDIFSYDMFQWYDELPENGVGLHTYQGADLAISTKTKSDFYANATIYKCPKTKIIYVGPVYDLKIGFAAQTQDIIRSFHEQDAILVGIEANAYQDAQVQNVETTDKSVSVRPVFTHKDKVTRAMKLSPKVQRGTILFNKKLHVNLISQLIKMPDGDHDDMFDALEIAVGIAEQGVKKKRPEEPGLI